MAPSGDETPDELADHFSEIFVDDDDLEQLQHDIDMDLINPADDKSICTFLMHFRPVFCVDFNSDHTLAVSGGENDAAFVWDTAEGFVSFECTGHKDSVTAVEFSFDDKYVATGDMSGFIQVWDVKAKTLTWSFEVNEMEWLFWHRSAHVLLAGVQSGEIYMWQIPQGNCKVFPTTGSKCTCGILLNNGTQLAAGYEDGNVRLWDLKNATVVQQLGHDFQSAGSIHNLVISGDDKILVACGLKVGALAIKINDWKIIATLYGESEEIETAAIYEEGELLIVATGCLKGDICLWDISRQSLRHKINIEYSVTRMLFGPNALLFVGAADGLVYVYSGKSCELLTTLTGHESAILDMKLSKDAKLLITASDDIAAKIFKVDDCCTVTAC